jgi:hypothetical protein
MMETESKKGEKRKLVIETDDEVNKDTGIQEMTSAKEVMPARGEKMIKRKTVYESKIRMEFNIKEGVDCFNIRSEVLKILNRMHLVDQEVYVKDGEEKWKDNKAFPSGKQFKTIFRVRREDPIKGNSRMIAYLNIVSSLKLRQFKENYLVMNHLKTEEVWLKITKFERKKISSPGFIMDIHPKLTNIFTLKQEIEYALRDVKSRGATTINKWKKNNDATTNKENLIPQFFINTTMTKFGDGKNRVEACVFGIECAEQDAGYLKTLLSLGYEQT